MRKICLLLLIVMMLFASAQAEQMEPFDPVAQWFNTQALALNPAGIEAREQRDIGAVLTLPDGAKAQSLRLTVEGDLRFGRYAQLVCTALRNAETGEEIALDAVFPDVDALREYLDAYVEERVADELNTYLDANELLPVPLDAVYFDATGVTFHYPMERFQFFSGHAGAVHLMWYELRDFLAVQPEAQSLPLMPGGQIDDLLAAYGSLTDPDLVAGGEVYEFEAPALRGVQAIADADGRVTAVRYARFSIDGAEPDMARAEAEMLPGAPEALLPLTEDAAAALRLRAGTAARYTREDGRTLTLYFDADDVMYLAEFGLE